MYKVYRMQKGVKVPVQSGSTQVFTEKRAREIMRMQESFFGRVYLLERVED